MTDEPFDLDKHRGMAAQKATDLRRVLAEVESNARELRDRQAHLENQLLSVPAASWPEAAAKARYVPACMSQTYRLRTPVIAILSQRYWTILHAWLVTFDRPPRMLHL